MVLTVTLGPHATRRVIGCPSRVKYGMWNWNATVRSVVTEAPPCWTIPLKMIGLWSAALKIAATMWGNAFDSRVVMKIAGVKGGGSINNAADG